MHKTLQDLIAATSELAALPITVVKLLSLLDDMTVGADKVLTIIGKDPSLTSNLLKLCNSAYYGVPRRIGSVKEALILLGNKTVVTLAFASGMGEVLRRPLTAYGLGKDDLWCHALATALGASYISAHNGSKDLQDRAFTAGLVHDIGKLLLDKQLVKQLRQLPAQAEDAELLQAEREILGYDHCEAGAALAEAWSFPDMLALAIRYHHDPVRAGMETQLARDVAAANLIAKSLGLGRTHSVPMQTNALESLTDQGIREETILHLLQSLPSDIDELLGAFVRVRPA